MAEGEPRRIGFTIEVKPHAYDPATNPELFEGVLPRRVIAFFIDLDHHHDADRVGRRVHRPLGDRHVWRGLAPLLRPGAGRRDLGDRLLRHDLRQPMSATIGMRVMDLEMRTWYGAPMYALLGAAHGLAYWVTVGFLTLLVLLVGLFNERRRLLHDMLVGTVVINNPARAAALRPPMPGSAPPR